MLNARFLIALGLFIVFLIGMGYFFYGLQPVLQGEEQGEEIEFRIDKGESFRSIGARLSQESLIKSIVVFKLYSFITGRAQRLQPGVYKISPEMSVPAIVKTISSGGRNEVAVTIPEGVTIKDINAILVKAGVLDEAASITNVEIRDLVKDYPFLEHISSLEGFLFPDTYRLEIGSSPEEVVRKLLNNFVDKAWDDLKRDDDWYSMLTLASFLEREVTEFENRQIVAGILLKRLRAGIPLQVDATLSYIKCNGEFLGCKDVRVLRTDTELVSPYNTYKRLGWTPTPISNPGEEAIEATLNSKPSPYWYYLSARETGETIFSRTLDEHNENRAKYL